MDNRLLSEQQESGSPLSRSLASVLPLTSSPCSGAAPRSLASVLPLTSSSPPVSLNKLEQAPSASSIASTQGQQQQAVHVQATPQAPGFVTGFSDEGLLTQAVAVVQRIDGKHVESPVSVKSLSPSPSPSANRREPGLSMSMSMDEYCVLQGQRWLSRAETLLNKCADVMYVDSLVSLSAFYVTSIVPMSFMLC